MDLRTLRGNTGRHDRQRKTQKNVCEMRKIIVDAEIFTSTSIFDATITKAHHGYREKGQ
jgi:hypothetical protein